MAGYSPHGLYHRTGQPVWATSREVIRALRERMRPEARTSRAHRQARHRAYRDVLAEHERARDLVAELRL